MEHTPDSNPTGSVRRQAARKAIPTDSPSIPPPTRRKNTSPTRSHAARSPRSAAGAAVKSIYFSDPDSLTALEAAVSRYTRSSVSHIIGQLTKLFTDSLHDVEDGERKIPINGHVYL